MRNAESYAQKEQHMSGPWRQATSCGLLPTNLLGRRNTIRTSSGPRFFGTNSTLVFGPVTIILAEPRQLAADPHGSAPTQSSRQSRESASPCRRTHHKDLSTRSESKQRTSTFLTMQQRRVDLFLERTAARGDLSTLVVTNRGRPASAAQWLKDSCHFG
jgi:hypothetical protein